MFDCLSKAHGLVVSCIQWLGISVLCAQYTYESAVVEAAALLSAHREKNGNCVQA